MLTTLATEILQRKQDMQIVRPAIHSAVASGSLGLVRLLLQIDLAQVHVRDGTTEDTAIHVAARSGHVDTVVALFQVHARYPRSSRSGLSIGGRKCV